MRKQSVPGPLPSSWEGPGDEARMTTAQKSKETRRMEMGSIFVLSTIPTYTSGNFRL